MGGSSSKGTFTWQKKKKKKSPLNNAWGQLRGALPAKKRKKKSKLSLNRLNLDNLKREKKRSRKKFSVSTEKKEPLSLKRLSLGNVRREPTAPGGLGNSGEQIKKKFSLPL